MSSPRSAPGSRVPLTLERFAHDAILTDVRIEARDGARDAHRVLLAAGSKYFEALFAGPCSQSFLSNNTTCLDISVETLDLILKFLYTGQLKAPLALDSQLFPLLLAVNQLQMDQLQDWVQQEIISRLDRFTCVSVVVLSDQLMLEDLRNAAVEQCLAAMAACTQHECLKHTSSLIATARDIWSVEEFVAAVQATVDFAPIQRQACNTFIDMSQMSRTKGKKWMDSTQKLVERLVDAGAFEACVAAMRSHTQDADLVADCAGAMAEMCQDHTGCEGMRSARIRQRAVSAGVLEVLAQSLQMHRLSPITVENGCARNAPTSITACLQRTYSVPPAYRQHVPLQSLRAFNGVHPFPRYIGGGAASILWQVLSSPTSLPACTNQ